MTPEEFEAALWHIYDTGPGAGEAIDRMLAIPDCGCSRARVLAAVESGMAVAEWMAAVARAQTRTEGESA